MAAAKPAPGQPPAQIVKQVTDEVVALHQQQAAPDGTQAAPGDFKKIGALLKKFAPVAIEVLTAGADGVISPGEITGIAARVYEAFKLLQGGAAPSA